MSDDNIPPIMMEYTGEGLKIRPGYWQKLADQHYVIGAHYRIVAQNEVSQKSRGHYFATIKDAFANLPDEKLVLHKSAEALRKHALIACGYADQMTFACKSRAEAIRLQAFMQPIDEFSVIVAVESTVTRFVAKSQSMRAMGKEKFEESKSAVLAWIAAELGVSLESLRTNTGQSGDGQR